MGSASKIGREIDGFHRFGLIGSERVRSRCQLAVTLKVNSCTGASGMSKYNYFVCFLWDVQPVFASPSTSFTSCMFFLASGDARIQYFHASGVQQKPLGRTS